MDTPICDFVRDYAAQHALRLHMPGHKGTPLLGMEHLDITEIDGADSLYEAGGIIRRSEANASAIFGCDTFYSTEGSSQCVRAMLYLVRLFAGRTGRRPLIAAGRNVHKTFLSAAALLDLDVMWLYSENGDSYLSCELSAQYLERVLMDASEKPAAVYLTSPDYLGNVLDIARIAEVCRRYGVLLAVDSAHGAYLKFLSRHPMDLGADLCCASAHKTLPVLTGGAYLHLSADIPAELSKQAKNALALFGSTSPSYLILQSLDAANAYLEEYPKKLAAFLPGVEKLKALLIHRGYSLCGSEPLKITISTKPFGYTGQEMSQMLLRCNIVCEFADPDFLVLMLTPELGEEGLLQLEKALLSIPRRSPVLEQPPRFGRGERILSVREAVMSAAETIPVSESKGRILAAATVGCPPAVPVLVCGERIDDQAIACFRYYGMESCTVVAE